MKQHLSAQEYVRNLMFTIMEADAVAPQPLPTDLLEYWGKEIYDACVARYDSYINKEVDDYRLNDEEIMDLLEEANRKLIGDTLATLVEKGAVKMSIDENGEVLYSATDEGKKMLNDEDEDKTFKQKSKWTKVDKRQN